MTNITAGDPGPIPAGLKREPETTFVGASYVPQIIKAHEDAVIAQKSGYQRSLDAAIRAGELLHQAKETVGRGWTSWRETHLPNLPQTTASLYMRLAENKAKLIQSRINNAVVSSAAEGKLSIRKADQLLANKRPRGKPPSKQEKEDTPKPEAVAKEFLQPLDVDELIIFLRQVFDAEYLAKLARTLAAPIERRV